MSSPLRAAKPTVCLLVTLDSIYVIPDILSSRDLLGKKGGTLTSGCTCRRATGNGVLTFIIYSVG